MSNLTHKNTHTFRACYSQETADMAHVLQKN